MKKIPTLFERDWNGDKSRVTPQVHAGCEWVLAGEGKATRKIDGTCCLVRDGKLYRRRELRDDAITLVGFEACDHDPVTRKVTGWVPVGEGAEDRYHVEAFNVSYSDGTYELVGPKVQGNPEKYECHRLIAHRDCEVLDAPRTFEGIRDWMKGKDIEGLVFHHPDGRMAKIKLRDFGLKRGVKS